MAEIALEVRQVSKVYREGGARVTALEDVSLAVRRGEVALLMGPSGSGKTTLLSVMGCLLRPTAGRIEVEGVDVTDWDESLLPHLRRECIGFVFQQFNLLAGLTARENVEVPLRLAGAGRREARARATALLTDVGLGDRADFHPADLSGGEKQRVALARAIAAAPPIVLADEPTANLDSAAGRAVADLLARLARREGCALVIVTHDERIVDIADRIHRIEDGRLVSDGGRERGRDRR